MISFLISLFFFFKKQKTTLHTKRERCCLPGEMKIAENILREYFPVLPWEKLLHQRFNIWKQFRNFLYIFVHRMFQRAWRRLLKNLKLMTAYWKFIKATHGMFISSPRNRITDEQLHKRRVICLALILCCIKE